MKPVKLKDIVDELEMQMDEYKKYLHKLTGEIITVSTEELSIAEDSEEDDDFSEYADWQQDSIKSAIDILENWENYIELPDKWEINEYDIVEEFCGSIRNDRISDALYSAIKGRGAFRRFKDTIIRFGIANNWFKFREETLKQTAIEWCEQNENMYIV